MLLRRHIHAHPELSFQEVETQKYVLRELEGMGLRGAKIARTGVIARVGPESGPCIALRADMDALAVTESTGKQYPVRQLHEHAL